jgi:hypothetical protein
MSVVTEPSAPSSHHPPKRPPAAIEDLDLLVKVTGRPDAIRAYTAAEQSEAEAYAAAVGGVIEPLPTTSFSARPTGWPAAQRRRVKQ